MLFNDVLNSPKFCRPETAARLESHGIKPELGDIIVSFDVYVNRFPAVARVEEEPLRPDSQHCGHRPVVLP